MKPSSADLGILNVEPAYGGASPAKLRWPIVSLPVRMLCDLPGGWIVTPIDMSINETRLPLR